MAAELNANCNAITCERGGGRIFLNDNVKSITPAYIFTVNKVYIYNVMLKHIIKNKFSIMIYERFRNPLKLFIITFYVLSRLFAYNSTKRKLMGRRTTVFNVNKE